MKRVKPPPCEIAVEHGGGCAKGHWRNPKELNANGLQLMRSYELARATGGASLTKAELNDGFHMEMLRRIDIIVRSGEASQHAQAMGMAASATLAARMLGGGKKKGRR